MDYAILVGRVSIKQRTTRGRTEEEEPDLFDIIICMCSY